MNANWTGTYRGYETVQREIGGPIEIWYRGEFIEIAHDGRWKTTIDAYLDAA